MGVGRRERRLLAIADRLQQIARDEALAVEELGIHRHLDDDARRDAAVSENPMDRAGARETGADVARFEAVLTALARERERLEKKRARLLRKLD
jgi:hypothetical protein